MLKFGGSLCVLAGISLLCTALSFNPVIAFSLLLTGFGVAVLVF